MWYIIEDEERVYLELGDTDIFDYMGQDIYCEDEDTLIDGVIECHTINDSFLTDYDWFDDMDDYDKIDAYRRAMYGQWQHAIDNWEDAYVGEYDSEASFSQAQHEELVSHLPTHIRHNIDWQGVWDSTDRHSFFESDGFYFQHL